MKALAGGGGSIGLGVKPPPGGARISGFLVYRLKFLKVICDVLKRKNVNL